MECTALCFVKVGACNCARAISVESCVRSCVRGCYVFSWSAFSLLKGNSMFDSIIYATRHRKKT